MRPRLMRPVQTSRYLRYANTLAMYIATEHLESGNYAAAKKCVTLSALLASQLNRA